MAATTTIAKMPVAFRSGHFMIQLETPNQDFFGSEVTVIHDGTKVNAIAVSYTHLTLPTRLMV